GGFGEVWLARHQNTKEERVFKFCFDPERLRSFRRELTLFRLLRDALGKREDIAALYDVSVEMPPFYLESEYLPQGNLSQWSESVGGIDATPLQTRLEIMARTARATDAAHSVGIVHKDIKPSNILIALTDGEPRPRLADFGIGTVTDQSALNDFGITQVGFTQSIISDSESGTQSMTQLYAPPEYLVGGASHPKGDIYSLGVMLYQLVVGDLKKPLASGWKRDVPDTLLQDIIEKCVDVEPERRFETAGQLAERLENLEERRAQLDELARIEDLKKQSIKRRRMLLAGGLVCGGLLALCTILGLSYLRQKKATAKANEATTEAVKLRAEAKQMASHSDFLVASHLAEKGQNAESAAFLARSLRDDPTNRSAVHKLFSVLTSHRFIRPAFPLLHTFKGGSFDRNYIATFAPDGERVIAQNDEEKLTLYDLQAGKPVGEPYDHRGEDLVDAVFVNDGTRILAVTKEEDVATSDAGARLRLWDTETGRLIRQDPQGNSPVRHLWLDQEGQYWLSMETIAVGARGQLWDLSGDASTWKSTSFPRPPGSHIFYFRKAKDRNRLISVSRDAEKKQIISYLDYTGGKGTPIEGSWTTVATLDPWIISGHHVPAESSADGRYLAFQNNAVTELYDLDRGETVLSIEKPGSMVVKFTLSPRSDRLAIGYFLTGSNSAEIWDIGTKEKLPFKALHESGVTSITFSPNGEQLLTGSMDQTARLWDIKTGLPLTEPLTGCRGWVVTGEFSSDGRRIRMTSLYGTAAVWDLGGLIARPAPFKPELGGANWALSKDGRWVVGSINGNAEIHPLNGDPPTTIDVEIQPHFFLGLRNDVVLTHNMASMKVNRYDLITGQSRTYAAPGSNPIMIGGSNGDGTSLIIPHATQPFKYLLWDFSKAEPGKPRLLDHGERAAVAGMSEDGRRAVTITQGKTYLWDLTTDPPTSRDLDVGAIGFNL
ncbi:MAG: WD40 repeat domain-containing serine/threonine protein kinase, partial [Verrucomicrobiota bacterium]